MRPVGSMKEGCEDFQLQSHIYIIIISSLDWMLGCEHFLLVLCVRESVLCGHISFPYSRARTEMVCGDPQSKAESIFSHSPEQPAFPSCLQHLCMSGGTGRGIWIVCLHFHQCVLLLSGFLSGLGHNRCWFGLALVLCRHLPTSQSARVWHSLR